MRFYHNSWTPKEDEKLVALIHAGKSWQEVSFSIPGRTSAACQTRWVTHFKDPDKRKRQRIKENAIKNNQCKGDGAPIKGGFYIFRVPEGDPYLQQLILVHGQDTIDRNMVLPKSAQRSVVRTAVMEV